MTFGFRWPPATGAVYDGLSAGLYGAGAVNTWSQMPSVEAPIGVRTRMLASTGRQAGVAVGVPPLAISIGTPAQLATSMRTVVLPCWSITRSGTGLPAATDCAHVGRPVVPPRSGSQHAQVVARMRLLSFEVPTIVMVWLPVFGSLGALKR